jgi:amino acid efflux transporter
MGMFGFGIPAIALTGGYYLAAPLGLAPRYAWMVAIVILLLAATIGAGLASVGTVFFAFTGWEMLSFTAEEYRNPRRDSPRTVAISFLIVTGVYLLLAVGVQTQLNSNDSPLAATPARTMVANVLGGQAGTAVAVLAVVIILANVIGAMWGASRLVMSSAWEGLLPAFLRTHGEPNDIPIQRVLPTTPRRPC